MGKTTTIEKTKPAQADGPAVPDVPTCQHHWIIETPQGATSRGYCKRCGEEREFRNSAADHLWEDESGSGYNAWRGVRSTPSRGDEEEVSVAGASGATVMV